MGSFVQGAPRSDFRSDGGAFGSFSSSAGFGRGPGGGQGSYHSSKSDSEFSFKDNDDFMLEKDGKY
jgi:hypothetical protein